MISLMSNTPLPVLGAVNTPICQYCGTGTVQGQCTPQGQMNAAPQVVLMASVDGAAFVEVARRHFSNINPFTCTFRLADYADRVISSSSWYNAATSSRVTSPTSTPTTFGPGWTAYFLRFLGSDGGPAPLVSASQSDPSTAVG